MQNATRAAVRRCSLCLALAFAAAISAACGGDAGGGADAADGAARDAGLQDGARDTTAPADGAPLAEVADGSGTPSDTPPDDGADAGGGPWGGFPAEGMALRIVAPAAGGGAAVSSAVVPIRGVLFGRVDTLTWGTQQGESGAIEPAPFWTLRGLALVPGDNVLTVTATGPAGSVSDRLVLTYNPSFPFGGPPEAVPPALFADERTVVHVSVPLGRSQNFLADSVELHRVDARLASVARLAVLADDGAVGASGDEIEGDGRWSGRVTLTCAGDEPVRVRVTLQALTASSQYRAQSATLTLPCVRRIAPTRCAAVRGLLDDARARVDAALAQEGTTRPAAAAAAAGWLAQQPEVAAAGSDGDGSSLWLVGADGLLGAADIGSAGLRGGGAAGAAPTAWEHRAAGLEAALAPGSRRALVLDPAGGAGRGEDEATAVAAAFAAAGCPGWSVEGPHEDAAATLARLRDLRGRGAIALAAHGGAVFGGLSEAQRGALGWRDVGPQAIVWSGEPVDCSALQAAPRSCAVDADCPAGLRCLVTAPEGGACFDARQVDLALGRVTVGADTWGVLPAFFAAHAAPLPESVVWLGACRTLQTGGLAAAFYAAGARAVFGWDGPVSGPAATAAGASLFRALLDGERAGAAVAGVDADPAASGRLVLFGADGAALTADGLLDPGFESGSLAGWTVSGDVRVLERLGSVEPVEGRRMAVVSTGLGLDRRNGSLRQTFCVPRDGGALSFWWKALSEEIPLHCGLVSQDRFTAELRGPDGSMTAVDVAIDDLCPPAACTGCGAAYSPLSPADVAFGRGAAVQTEWQRARFLVEPFRYGGPVELVLTVRDQGDSEYDTAILLDGFELR